MAPHRIWFSVQDGIQALDLVGPFEVFVTANQVAEELGRKGIRYDPRVVTLQSTPVRAESGLGLSAEIISPSSRATPDTLMLPGGVGIFESVNDTRLTEWIRTVGGRCERLACVCTGSFLAAEAGLLDGLAVATHWARANRLQRQYPEVRVDRDSLHLRAGRVWSSAGVMAGMDLALAMVESDMDAEVAQHVARWLVVHLRRPGTQSQFASPVWQDASQVEPIRRAQELIQADPSADLTVENLATRVGLSARHFTRVFQAELGETPAKFIERIRVESARQQLERNETDGMDEVARANGFGTAETMRRAFVRRIGMPPDEYRRRFALAPSA